MLDPYKTLKVPRTATPEQITKAYRALVMKYHPDRCPGDKRAEKRFKAVQEAYDLLSDPARRSRFDATGETNDRKVDAEMANVIRIAGAIFFGVVAEAISTGRDPASEDLMQSMRQVVAKGHETLSRERLDVQKQKNQWQRVVGRFVVADGVNHLEQMAQHKLAEMEARLRDVEKQLVQNEAVMAFLKNYSFNMESYAGFGGMTTFGWRSSTSY